MLSPGLAEFKLSFQICPIFLVGGIASQMPGNTLPIISITQAQDFSFGVLGGSDNIDLDSYFANFQPMPGGTLIDNQVGMYPFANQAVAANAIIAQPLVISMLMLCPVGGATGYFSKLSTMMSLQATLKQHNASEGTYTVITPSFYYTNCIMTNMKDVTGAQTKQVQEAWQLDFFKPLLTLEDAQQAQNNLMSKISSGTAVSGDPPTSFGNDANVGSGIGAVNPSVTPASSSMAGGTAVPYTTGIGAYTPSATSPAI